MDFAIGNSFEVLGEYILNRVDECRELDDEWVNAYTYLTVIMSGDIHSYNRYLVPCTRISPIPGPWMDLLLLGASGARQEATRQAVKYYNSLYM